MPALYVNLKSECAGGWICLRFIPFNHLYPKVKTCCLLSTRRHKEIVFVQIQRGNSAGRCLNIFRHFAPAFLVVVRGRGMDATPVSASP